jgi:cytochrome P450
MLQTDRGLTAAPASGALPLTFDSLLKFAHDPLQMMRRLHRAHGNVAALEDDGQRLVFAFGPDYVKRVLSDANLYHSNFFAIRGPRNSAQRHLTCGLLNMNGEEHKRHRRLVKGPFEKQALARYRDALVGLAGQLVQEWKPGTVRDVFPDMTRYMLRVTSNLLFGLDMPALAYEIGNLIERWVRMNHEVGMGAFVSDRDISSSYSGLLALAEQLEDSILAMIAHRRSAALGMDVLAQLIRAHDATGTAMTDAELIGQTTVLFGAAHLTTANTLTWTLFLLAQHPRVASELAQELSDVLGGAAPTLEQLERLPLLDCVLKESMRLLPASAYSQRLNAEPTDLGPFRLAKGTCVIFSQIITHHMPDVFPAPQHFRPERWRTITPSPYAYFPFAAGPRKCVGAGLALMTLKITLATILQRFHLSVEPGAAVNGDVTFTMLNPTSGMPMHILPATAPFAAVAVQGNIHDLVDLEPATRAAASPSRAA